MQTSSLSKRLLAVVLAAIMMLTAIPFSFAADETAAKDTIVFGGISWDIVTKEADGDLVLVTTDVLAKAAFNAKAPMNFATSSLYTTLNTDFYATFSDAEKAAIVPTTITYDYWDATAGAKVTGATLSANVVVPDVEMAKSLGIAYYNGTATAYYLASARADKATDAVVAIVSKSGDISNVGGALKTTGYRAVITLKAGSFAQFPAVDGVSYTVNDKAVTYYATTSATSFKVAVDTDNYAADELAVVLGSEALTAADGVYTIPAGSAAELSVSGVKAQPADFTAYNEAVAKAEEVDRDLCDTTDLDAALAVDVSACTKLEQAKVDEAAAAILDAIANLKYKPADTAAYLEALAELRTILANEPVEITPTLTASLYNLNAEANEIGDNFNNVIRVLLNSYEDRTDTPVSGYTIDKQAEVDAATAEIEDLIARVPLMRASTADWSSALNTIKNLSPNRYSNAAELIAEAEALVAENDYAALNLDITHQAEVDEATAKFREIAAKAVTIPADYTALDEALAIADTYLAENFYTEEEMAGAGAAWEDFVKQFEAAKAIDRSQYTTYADHQKTIDDLTAVLTRSMEVLDEFERLTPWEEFWKPVKDFFKEVSDFFGLVGGILKFVGDIIKLLIKGEIEFNVAVWDILDLIGDEDISAFVEKIIPRPTPAE